MGDLFWDAHSLYQSQFGTHGVFVWKKLGKIVDERQTATDRRHTNGLQVFESQYILDNGDVYILNHP